MQNSGRMGLPGVQGNSGPQSFCFQPTSPNVRYITSGGSRSLFRYDSVIICNSVEKITLQLPFIEFAPNMPDDYYYNAIFFSLFVLEGSHRVIAANGNRINSLITSVDVEENSTRYDFISTPNGWIYTIHKSSV